MNSRNGLWLTLAVLATFAVGALGYNYLAGVGQADTNLASKGGKPAEPLPIKQVVLFNSGVGYFQREGEIDGNARVDLAFPAGDINDLLKSLVLQDPKGRIGAVNYDSSDPIDKILRSFAIDLTSNPTFGQILNQARGEKIEISRSEKNDGQVVKVPGTIVGIEVQRRPISGQVIHVDVLNLHTATGLQAIPMAQIVSVRFQNPVLENEFQRALQVVARSHDSQKKTVSIGFTGEGKRPVKVGYVVERPVWKTTYRLRIDAKDKVFLQAWALVENTSDDDWNDVRMVLVSGKPISFRMNLYDPLYIARPLVEPELFASLRPPVYSGALDKAEKKDLAHLGDWSPDGSGPPKGTSKGDPADRKYGRVVREEESERLLHMLLPDGKEKHKEFGYDIDRGKLNSLIAQWGRLPASEKERMVRDMIPSSKGNDELATQRTVQALKKQVDAIVKMEEAKKVGEAVTGFNFKDGVQSVATASEIGDYFEYVIDQKISLPRQKSAMLPILNQTIDGNKYSIYNESVHAKYPLLGLKLKNTSDKPLTQGPITVYDGGVFAGDTRILDLQPGEERLLSYAIDQGTEVKTETKESPSPDMTFKIGSDTFSAAYDMRQTKTYTIKNRSPHDRQVIVEHPLRAGWKLVEPKKPMETTRDMHRFVVSVPTGKTVTFDVVEDNPRTDGSRRQYEIDTGIHVKTETTADLHKLTGVKIVKGVVMPTHKTRESKTYFIQNLSDVDRTFTVDHVVRPDWSRLDDKGDPQAGPEVFRFKLSIAKGKTGQQSVREERSLTDKGSPLKNLSELQIKAYLASGVASADVKAAFTKALAMQAKIGDAQKQIADVDKQLTIVTADHTRVRENLKIIPMTSEHYKTFLEKFVAQDKQIESLQKNARDLNATLQGQMRDYDEYLAKLDAE